MIGLAAAAIVCGVAAFSLSHGKRASKLVERGVEGAAGEPDLSGAGPIAPGGSSKAVVPTRDTTDQGLRERDEPIDEAALISMMKDWARSYDFRVEYDAAVLPDWYETPVSESDGFILLSNPEGVVHIKGLRNASPRMQAEFEAYALQLATSMVIKARYIAQGRDEGWFPAFSDRAAVDEALKERPGKLHWDGEHFLIVDMAPLEAAGYIERPEVRYEMQRRSSREGIGGIAIVIPDPP